MKKFIGKYILNILLDISLGTITYTTVNKPENMNNKIFIFWHANMLIGWRLFKGMNFSCLVSFSSDGDILSNVLKKWEYNVIRGSSSKGGKEAVNYLIKNAKKFNSIVITPDGPRGPALEIKNGALIISLKTGFPIIPVKIECSKRKILDRSWDRFQIPYPFSRCTITYGNEFFYNKILNDDELISFKKQLKEQM